MMGSSLLMLNSLRVEMRFSVAFLTWRFLSVSSILIKNLPLLCLANKKLYKAVRSPPT